MKINHFFAQVTTLLKITFDASVRCVQSSIWVQEGVERQHKIFENQQWNLLGFGQNSAIFSMIWHTQRWFY